MTATVYLIDSDDYFSSQVMRGCARMGIKARRIADGNEGVRQALEDRPDAVILGLMDDNGAGYALCSKLRRKARELPVIMVITAEEQSNRRLAEHRAMGTAADSYLQRPFTLKMLHETLTALLPTRLPAPRGSLADLVGQNVSSEDALFGGIFDDEDDDDIAAAADEWFASIITDESMGPAPAAPPPPRVAPDAPDQSIPMLAVEDLEINLDELVPPEEDEVLSALRRENANLRDRLANASEPRESRSQRPSGRRELIEARQRLNERERELLEVRDSLMRSEKEALELEEALEAAETKLHAAVGEKDGLGTLLESVQKKLADTQDQLKTTEAAGQTAQTDLERAQAALETAQKQSATLQEELEGLRAVHTDTQSALKAAEEAWEKTEEEKEAQAKNAKAALEKALSEAETQAAEAEAAARVKLAEMESSVKAEADKAKKAKKAADKALEKTKATHADDMHTLEQMHEEALAELTHQKDAERETLKTELETNHAKALAEMLDRAEVAEAGLAEKAKALVEYETATKEFDSITDGLRKELAAKTADLSIYEASAAEAEEKLATALASLKTLEPQKAALELDLGSAQETIKRIEEELKEAQAARMVTQEKLDALVARQADQEKIFEKVRTALHLAHDLLGHASNAESPVDPAEAAAKA